MLELYIYLKIPIFHEWKGNNYFSIWLIVWIFASLVSFFVWNFSLFLNSSYADLILGFSIVISLLLCVLVFIGASMIFMDESCKKGSTYLESYYLWVICSAISAFWINIFGVIFLRYLSIFLHANGVTEFKPFESGIFAVVHIILFEITVKSI